MQTLTSESQTMDAPKQGLPVTIITGFLGSGKTTLLNHILTNQQGLKTAVLVNEFGEIGIDNELVVSTDENMVELNNGCICCTINSDLNWRQKVFLAWIAPKGIVSASVASLFAILLTERGINGGDAIKALSKTLAFISGKTKKDSKAKSDYDDNFGGCDPDADAYGGGSGRRSFGG